MRITIDTQKDSHDDLRKIMQLLAQIVGAQAPQQANNIFEDSTAQETSSQNVSGVFGNLFDAMDKPPENPPENKQPPRIEFY